MSLWIYVNMKQSWVGHIGRLSRMTFLVVGQLLITPTVETCIQQRFRVKLILCRKVGHNSISHY